MCFLTNERYKTYQMGFPLSPGPCPQGWDFGAMGCPGGQTFMFSNIVMWQFKSTRMTAGTSHKVSKGAKIRNRYNQVPHLTQDTNGKVKNRQ